MLNQLQAFDGRRYESVMDFMRVVKHDGLADEFDISPIMRMMWAKVHEIQEAIGKTDGSIYLTMKTEESPKFSTVLKVTLHSSLVENVTASLDLFMRTARLTVSTNVLEEEVKPEPNKTDVLAAGVYWFEAEKLFKECPRFDKTALKAFRALYKALSPRGDAVAVRLQITPLQLGWRVEYRMHGVKILVAHFDFNK